MAGGHHREGNMAQRIQAAPQEPVGIVIHAGWHDDVTPRFAAFVWGPAPEDDARQAVSEPKAA